MRCGHQFCCEVDRSHQCLFSVSVFDFSVDSEFLRQSEGPGFTHIVRPTVSTSRLPSIPALLFQTAMTVVLVWWHCSLHLVTAHSLLISCQPIGRCSGFHTELGTGLSFMQYKHKRGFSMPIGCCTIKRSACSEECSQLHYPAALF